MPRFSLIVPNTRYRDNYLWSKLPSRGLLSLAAVLQKDGYPVQYIDADIDNMTELEIIAKITEYNSDIVGITMNTFQSHAGLSLAYFLKSIHPDIKIIVGGPHPSALGKQMLLDHPCIDIICLGEGEEMIVELAEALKYGIFIGSIPGICYRFSGRCIENDRRQFIDYLDYLPFPAYELSGKLTRYPGAQPVLKSPSMHIMASRGCPYSCTFCTKSVWGRRVRFRSVGNIVNEIEMLHYKFGINEIFFQDDTMNLDRVWFFAICDEIIKRELNHLSYKAPFRVNKNLVDEGLLSKAKEAGFWMIFYGVESGSQEVLNTIEKGTTVAEIERAFRLTHNAGILTIAAFMVGNIGDTRETVQESVELAKRIRPDVFGFSIATPLPGTRFYDIAKAKGWILNEDFSQYSQFTAVSRNEALTASDITELRNRADKEVRQYFG